ncbi:L-rhamnose mutarotase [Microbacterium sp. Leaf151]|uniref:L-rhamnose mutarotase n=1 Tax=Microbacterium sp. Leaf151 TaxID=1736276 RepID=UPI0006F61A4F|nr:L-rhamnose mutarotase [Microbacterium sp. Leaf151]KQR25862.1 L-rhamnose 1-epimerase [Microbacterium sp. Leaf151]
MTAQTTRVCFELRIRPELIDEYVARHTPVRADMLAEIAAAGRRNYSLFLGEGGRLVGYYETDDDAAAQAYLAASPIAAAWEAEMAPFFLDLDGRPDRAATALTEIFHLADQLANAGSSASPRPGAASAASPVSEAGSAASVPTEGTRS